MPTLQAAVAVPEPPGRPGGRTQRTLTAAGALIVLAITLGPFCLPLCVGGGGTGGNAPVAAAAAQAACVGGGGAGSD
jgi:hypothetical protein